MPIGLNTIAVFENNNAAPIYNYRTHGKVQKANLTFSFYLPYLRLLGLLQPGSPVLRSLGLLRLASQQGLLPSAIEFLPGSLGLLPSAIEFIIRPSLGLLQSAIHVLRPSLGLLHSAINVLRPSLGLLHSAMNVVNSMLIPTKGNA